MNDKQQLAAMGEHLAEQQQPMCLQKRVEQLEAQVRLMARLLHNAKVVISEAMPFFVDRSNCYNVEEIRKLPERIANAIAGNSTAVVAPEGWQLVPAEVTLRMQHAYFGVIDKNMQRVETDCRFGRYDSAKEAYRAMLAAAPKLGDVDA